MGGDSTYWYSWSIQNSSTVLSEADSIIVSPDNATTYRLLVGDSCTPKIDTSFFTLEIDTVLKLTISNDTTICKGFPVSFSASGSGCDTNQYLFSWVDSLDTSTVLQRGRKYTTISNTTTTYRVVLKDISTQLADTKYVRVIVDEVFDISLTQDTTICIGQSVDLVSSVTSCDTSQLIFTWDDIPDSTRRRRVSPIETTTYKVRIVNSFNGLNDSAEVKVEVRDSLGISVSEDTVICIEERVQLRASGAGGNSNSYEIRWYDSLTNRLILDSSDLRILPTQGTTYKAVLSDECTIDDDSAYVRVEVRDTLILTPAVSDTVICPGERLTLELVSGAFIGWSESSNPGLIISDDISLQVSPNEAIRYNSLGFCDTVDIAISLLEQDLDFDLGIDTTICEFDSLLLTSGVQDVKYLWSTGSTDTLINVANADTYWLEISNRCESNSDTIEVSVLSFPEVNLEADTVLCEGEEIQLDARDQQAEYLWNDGTDTRFFNVTQRGTYWVVVSNKCGSAGDSVLIDYLSAPKVSLGLDTSVCGRDSFVLKVNTDNAIAEWQDGTNLDSILVSRSETYRITLRNQCGIASDSVTIKVDECPCIMYIPNAFTPNGDGINDAFKIGMYCKPIQYRLLIYDRWGQLHFESTDPSESWSEENQGDIAPGSYLVLASSLFPGENWKSQSVVIQVIK